MKLWYSWMELLRAVKEIVIIVLWSVIMRR